MVSKHIDSSNYRPSLFRTFPSSNDRIWFEDGRHLFIEGIVQPVSYGLGEVAPAGDRQPIALLTGANSGGKTTLLELVAHITLLAHMGLPVPAKNAFIGRIESLHVLAKSGGTQSAGALETTLVEETGVDAEILVEGRFVNIQRI